MTSNHSNRATCQQLATQSSQSPSSQSSTDWQSGSQKQKKNVKPADMPKVALGSTPSSAFMQRFLARAEAERPPGVLPDQPCEIVQMIASYLDVDGVSSLRLTCSQLENKSFWYFSKTYFREVRFMHSRFALETLVAMSESRMCQYVQTLGLGPPSNDQGRILFDTTVAPKPGKTKKRNQIKADMVTYSEDNRRMRLMGEDAALIRAALQNLRRVTTLLFIEDRFHDTCCEFHPIRKSYGRMYLSEKIGAGRARFEKINLDATQSMARTVMLACHAAQVAGLSLECVDASMSCSARRNQLEKALNGFFVLPLDFPVGVSRATSTSASTFTNLSVLKIYIGARQDVAKKATRELFLQRFMSFLSQVQSLRTLHITFGERNGASELLEKLSSSHLLGDLEAFELASIDVSCQELIDILQPLRNSLQVLRLFDIHLIGFDYDNLFTWIRDNVSCLRGIHVNDYVEEYIEGHAGDDMEEFLDEAIEAFYDYIGM